jgi:aspartate-semialdehyde dehydrogenase
MPKSGFKITIVGAASLRGKEMSEALTESVFAGGEIALLDDDAALGQLEAVGDEVAFIRALTPESFDRQDFVFFAGSREQTENFWHAAHKAGATVVDVSQALQPEEAITMFPWQEAPLQARLDTPAVEVAHPVAQLLALIAVRVAAVGAVEFLSATVLGPASEQDRAGMDELHQQTVKLLSFQPLPKEVFDAQTAFNVLTATSADARVDLAATEQRILQQYAGCEGRLAPLLLQIAQAPVFHGYMVALHVRMAEPQAQATIRAALEGPHVEFVDEEWPSNLGVSGQSELLIKLRSATEGAQTGRDFRMWIAADNLRIAALTAVEAASSMRHLRPHPEVQ